MEKNNYYFDSKNLEVNTEGRGREIHPLVALAISAVLGAVFVFFLPFIGIYMLVKFLGDKAVTGIKMFWHNAISPVAVPGTAHFTGANPNQIKAEESELEDLHEEIQSKR